MIKPLRNRVVVERLEADEKTASGLIIPDSAQEKPQKGRVVAVGPGSRDKKGEHVPMALAKGDLILFGKYGGTDVTLDGNEYLILTEDDILGVIES